MSKNFHGKNKRHTFFEGWYFKQQKDGNTAAVIPAFHVDAEGISSASIQVITDEGAWYLPFSANEFQADDRNLWVKISENMFTDRGIRVNLKTQGLTMHGRIQFGELMPTKKDIMGPFRWFPFMQCSHQIISMSHFLQGELTVNGRKIDFSGGTGYIEKDFGKSFPDSYMWTQCCFKGEEKMNSIMIAAAHIPIGKRGFTGCICAVVYNGKQFRLGTYLGAHILYKSEREICIVQGRLKVKAEVLKEDKKPLQAPDMGRMSRTIHESASCTVRYEMYEGRSRIFETVCEEAGFEQV